MNRVIKEVFPTVVIVISDFDSDGSAVGHRHTALFSKKHQPEHLLAE
jgi:hypothetical protein